MNWKQRGRGLRGLSVEDVGEVKVLGVLAMTMSTLVGTLKNRDKVAPFEGRAPVIKGFSTVFPEDY